MLAQVAQYAGYIWMATILVIAFAVGWGVARDAVRRRRRLHKLQVMYARAANHRHDPDRRRLIASMDRQLAELRELREFER